MALTQEEAIVFMEDVEKLGGTPELARKYGVAERTIRRWKKNYRGLEKIEPIPEPSTKVYDEFMVIDSDRVLVLGDIEIPCHSAETLEDACKIAQKFELDTLIINGDFVALDSFSKWARSTVYKLAFKDELEPAIKIVKIFLSIFPRVYLTTGNHERRLAHRLDGEITIADFFSNMTGVEFSEYSYCILNSGGNEILVCHQDNYGRSPLTVARELASIHHKNIICGHCHHQAQGFDKSGKYFIVDGGCCRATEHTEYKATRINTFPMWNLGYTMVLNGHPYLINKSNVDFWLGTL